MRRSSTWFTVVAVLSMLAIVPAGCSSGGGGGTTSQPKSQTLSGIAAAGAPIVGIVNVKGANGATATAPIDADGKYSIDVTALTPNYILYAQGMVNGRSVKIYSAAVAAGNINITPITDLIVANAAGGLPETAFNNWNGSQVSAAALSAAETKVQADLGPILAAAGVADTIDLMTTSFTANHTGLDSALDYLTVTYNGTTATVTNTATGCSYSNNVTNPSTAIGLPPSDMAQTQAVMSELDGINVFWGKVNTLWATALPSQSAIDSQLKPLFAAEILDDGLDSALMGVTWSPDRYPGGITFSATIEKPMDASEYETGKYQKAYWIRVAYRYYTNRGSFAWSMVFDGIKWLAYGNRRWVEGELQAYARQMISDDGSVERNTGFNFSLEDNANYAYNHGVRSALIAGPPCSGSENGAGLPEYPHAVVSTGKPEFHGFLLYQQ